MPGSIVQSLWSTWESMFHVLWRVKPIGTDKPYLFYVSEQRYFGHPFTVDDVQVKKGDRVIEMHMNNQLIVEILREQKSAVGIAVRLLQEAKRSFPVLATYVSVPEFDHIHVLYGVTFINRSVERFGFHTFPIRRKVLASFTSWYLKKLFAIVNPIGKTLIEEHPDTLVPRVVAISRARFLANFPPVKANSELDIVDVSRHVPL